MISVLPYNQPNPSTPDPKHNLQTQCGEAVIYMYETIDSNILYSYLPMKHAVVCPRVSDCPTAKQ